MIISDTVQLALRNLRQSKLRTGLTTLGVAIGIASLAGMVSLGVGLQEQFVGRFTQSGLFDSITVVPLQANPLLRLGRKLTPGARTPDEHPLTVEDWALCASIFPGFRHTEQEFVTIPLMPLNLILPESARKALARGAIRADRATLRKFPSVRKYARTTFLILE